MSDLVPITEALPEPTPTTVFDWLDASVPIVWAMERRTAEGRQRVGQALWLLRGLLADGAYGEQVRALATTHEVSERTLRSWRAEAEERLSLTPHEATTIRHRKQLPVPRPAETGAEAASANRPLPTSRCETVDQMHQVAIVVRNTDWSKLPPVELAAMIETLLRYQGRQPIPAMSREAKPARKAVKPAALAGGPCKHPEWRLIGVTGYRCASCDTHLGLARPSHGRKVA